MSRSVTYRERETDREWEEQPKRSYTTVKRYQVPETVRSSLGRDDDETKEKIIIRRERREEAPREEVDIKFTERTRERERPREEEDYRFTERITERDREPRRDVTYRVIERERERDSDYDDRRSNAGRSDWRYSNYERDTRDTQTQVVRAPSPPAEDRVREYRFERERNWSPERRQSQPFEVEKYSKSTEYFSQPQPAPQPIIIRESAPPQPIIIREERRAPQPIIIREERREPHYEFIEREEVRDESRSLVRRNDPPSPSPEPQQSPARSTVARSTVARSTATAQAPEPQKQEEDYFYERRIREVDRAPRRHEESHDRRTEIRPKDSASNYSSDDSYEYVRKERTYEDDRDHSPHHKRHLAEGAIAGIGAAEILRHHRKSEGKQAGGRVKSTLGGAAVGALGAEVISRARSRRRGSGSRSRSSSYESKRDRRDKKKHRSRSRSKSMSRKQLAGLAGIAAVGALAGYALKNKGKNETVIVNDAPPSRHSRSRRRRGSPDSYMMEDETNREDDKHRDPDHRNRRIAQAGLASAAAAGIWERVRSKSRGGKSRERSKSRLRTGVPIAAAGLGGAALAGLYEKNKASKEAKRDQIVEDEMNRGRRRRSRSRSRSVPAPYPDERRRVDDRGLIAYGNEPVYPGDQGHGYYSDEEPGTYRRRHGGGSGGSSPDTRRRRGSRSRSRGRNFAEMGAAAGLGAVAAHEIGKRNNRQRGDRQRK